MIAICMMLLHTVMMCYLCTSSLCARDGCVSKQYWGVRGAPVCNLPGTPVAPASLTACELHYTTSFNNLCILFGLFAPEIPIVLVISLSVVFCAHW